MFPLITRIAFGCTSRIRSTLLRARGATVHGRVWLRRINVPRHARRLILESGVALDDGVTLLISGADNAPPALRLGNRVYVNRYTVFDASHSITVGDDCMIGPFCFLTDHDHSFGPDGRPASGELVSRSVVLEPGVWLGAHVTILKGVTVGTGAVVGAGSVVTKDVAAGTVVAGNPARPLVRRSTE